MGGLIPPIQNKERKSMKRTPWLIALLTVLIAAICLCVCACTDNTDNSETEPENSGEGNNTGDLILVQNGIPTFQFVASRDITGTAKSLINSSLDKINATFKEAATVISETSENSRDTEIFFGTPRYRGDEYKIDGHYLGPNGYAIKHVGNKVLVLYGSDEALTPALNHLENVIFGINGEINQLENVTLTEDMLIEIKQEFEIKSITVCGNDLRSYHIEYNHSAREFVGQIQNYLYVNTGIWLAVSEEHTGKNALIIREPEQSQTTSNGLVIYVDENSNLIIETEFPNKIMDVLSVFLEETALNPGTSEYDYGRESRFEDVDVRNIYYEDFGAKGDGVTDDLPTIKKCHDYANKYGHTVNATPGAIYYIGNNNQGTPAVIKTDTNWNGCYFIIDDTMLTQPLTKDQNGGTAVSASPGWYSPIFSVEPDMSSTRLEDDSLPINSIKKGANNVGFSLGYKAMLVLYNESVHHYIRYGANANDGSAQHELIIIDEYGYVDQFTPIQWDYETVSYILVYRIDDTPITISGGAFSEEDGIDNRAHFEQRYNVARSLYTYCYRNISITRSNVILENITHEYTDYGTSGAPYTGFTSINYCSNVTVRGIEFMCPPTFYLEGSGGTNNMGSYEISATLSNNVLYKNCTQSNFFESDGSIAFHGLMGTNYCKNLVFEDMFVCSFDAHCGVYNATIRNSTAEHLNFIGDGEILLENVVIYADATKTAINLRADYGSTWAGNVTINGLEMRYSSKAANSTMTIIKATWNNHKFGYVVHYPQNMLINDLSTVKYTYGIDENDERWEKIDESTRNQKSIYLISTQVGNHSSDLTNPDIKISGKINSNPVVPIQSVTVNNYKYKNTTVNITWPKSKTFNGMKITVDGVQKQ